ncbi:MAG TPA: hypothetical protein VD966_10780 [Pyrinomonadaceae bacterium]|nr:hypothetical protein [Pyrinomonadaceae bacterium]
MRCPDCRRRLYLLDWRCRLCHYVPTRVYVLIGMLIVTFGMAALLVE